MNQRAGGKPLRWSAAACSAGAGWSRSSRTITVHSEYISRFIDQGTRAAGESETPETSGTPSLQSPDSN